MKKTYAKPEIFFENFKMTSSIANGSCSDGFEVSSSSIDTCSYNHNGVKYFGSDNVCVYVTSDATCYQVPIPGVTLFAS